MASLKRDDSLGIPPTEELESAQQERSSRRLRLVVTSGPDRGQRLGLRIGSYRIGKDPGCDLVLADGAVSRHHLAVDVDGQGVRVRDLGSTNGSFFRGARFESIAVDRGAVITIGKTELRVEALDPAAALPPSEAERFGELLGTSEAMRRVFALLERIARTDSPVLVQGETGTGKELAARGLHEASARSAGPFVVCDLAGLSGSLSESELFGHVRGAFTGADRDRAGAFEVADGGTIFLDEIGELPLDVQPRLLRVLESGRLRRVGETEYRATDVRVVAATNRDLAAEVKAGRFRADLYHRFAVVVVELPPLRERHEDVPMLVEHFLARAAPAGAAAGLEPAVLEAMMEYHWPGNVRELRNLIERSLAVGVDSPLHARWALDAAGPARAAPSPSRAAAVDVNVPFHEAKEQLVVGWEREYLQTLVEQAGGNVSLAARRGGLGRAYLHRLLKKHGLTTD